MSTHPSIALRPPSPGAARLDARKASLTACTLGSATVFLDASMVPVGLPALAEELGGGLAAQQWVTVAYLLALGALVLVGGSLSDLFGRRRVFAIGALGLAGASLVCAMAPTIEVLIAARAVQGVAGALLVPSALALLSDAYGPQERGRAIGAWTAWTGLATVLGPLVGGLVVQGASWRGIFVLSAAPALGALWFLRLAPSRRASARVHVDGLGALLATLGLGALCVALLEQPQRGWGDPIIRWSLAAAAASLAGFVVRERISAAPMVPLGLFRRRNFSVATAGTVLLYAAFNASWFFIVLFLQQVAGYSPLEAGMALLPIPVLIFALSRRFGALADRRGTRGLVVTGSLLAGAGLALLVRVDAEAAYASSVLPGVLVLGLGLAMAVAPLTAIVLADVSDGQSGVAAGLNNAAARVSGLLAIAALGAVLAAHFPAALERSLADRGVEVPARTLVADINSHPLSAGPPATASPATEALASASVACFRLTMAICAALAALGGVVALAACGQSRRAVSAAGCPGGALCGASEDAAPMTGTRPG